jgi:multicomponent Na+:H+ antiporter subunit B
MRSDFSQINYVFTRFLLPFIAAFAAYIQVFGEVGPGGGFQAGALFASAVIAYDISISKIVIKNKFLITMASAGFFIYFFTGLFSLFMGDNFLNYYSISKEYGQSTGIILIEFGVGLCVYSVMFLIYQEFRDAN